MLPCTARRRGITGDADSMVKESMLLTGTCVQLSFPSIR